MKTAAATAMAGENKTRKYRGSTGTVARLVAVVAAWQ